MDSEKLNDWVQVVGIFALVASLVFVGLQIRQSHEIALANQYHARAEATQNVWLALLESGITLDQLISKKFSELTLAEQATLINLTYWSWTQYDNHYYQHIAGFLDVEAWDGIGQRIRDMYDTCEVRSIWDGNKKYYRPSFVDYVESLDDVC